MHSATRGIAIACAALMAAVASHAQFVGNGVESRAAKPQAVSFLFPEQVRIRAGTPSAVDLHFRVAPGLHINSHTPSDVYYIATTFSIADSDGVSLAAAGYPRGEQMALASDPGTKLSVYTGEFVIHAQIVSRAGNHLAQGKLHYQACNSNECMPPKTISVPIDVIAN